MAGDYSNHSCLYTWSMLILFPYWLFRGLPKNQPERDVWLGTNPPTKIPEITLDLTALTPLLDKNNKNNPYKDKIQNVRVWKHHELNINGELPGEVEPVF